MLAHVQAAPLDASFDGTFKRRHWWARRHAERQRLELAQSARLGRLAMQQGKRLRRISRQRRHASTPDQTTALNNIDLSLDAIRAHGNLSIVTPGDTERTPANQRRADRAWHRSQHLSAAPRARRRRPRRHHLDGVEQRCARFLRPEGAQRQSHAWRWHAQVSAFPPSVTSPWR